MVSMKKWSTLTVLLAISLSAAVLLSSVNAAPVQGITHEVHEIRKRAPSGWIQGERLSGNVILPVRIALAQSNMDKLHEYVMQVSDPDSPQYGQHWNPEDVQDTFKPSAETRETVSHWLIASGISPDRLQYRHGSGGWIAFDATVEEAERLFQTEYHSWSHDHALSSKPIAAVAESYSLPAHVRRHIDFVTPTLHFDARLNRHRDMDDMDTILSDKQKRDQLEKRKIDLGAPDGPSIPKKIVVQNPEEIIDELEQCDKYITPICLRALYGIPILPSFTPTNPANSFGIVEYTPQAPLYSDLKTFFANYSTNQKQIQPNLVSIDGGHLNNSNQGFSFNGESNLDLEYGMTLVNPIPVTLYQTGDEIESASFNNFLDALDASYCGGDDSSQDTVFPDPNPGGYKGNEACGTVKAAKVISTSYAYNEHDLTPAYEIRQCNEYAKLGLLGTTFVYSSGDYGVAGNEGQCIDPATGAYNDGKSGRFNPSFPGTCPYILSVGATEVLPGKTVLDPESACESVIYSGGGFSNVFELPSYQKSAVGNYFAHYNPPYTAVQYNNSQKTRGFPDVSANGANYIVDVAGQVLRVFGTSASAPVTASMLTLLNEARLDVGKSTLGFVNPTFYANPYLFNDITNGTNQGCGTDGYSAVPGWDPVTGLGTPNYPKLLAYFLSH